ncbi:MAG: DNA (cytosine-5-)-methyltransferase [Bacteroidaceae bacterium]|nr:DNA (cytosine-5-)-methyltransferase [Bacteroidaceae bacterium]
MNSYFELGITDYGVMPLEEQMAYITHYIHNINKPEEKYYSQIANELIRDISEPKSGNDEFDNCLHEDTFQYNLFADLFKVPFPSPIVSDFTFIDLFAGIGGFRIPLQWEKGRCVFSSEFNSHAQKVYLSNYGEVPFGDITKIPVDRIPPHDVLTAGFPCQPFSISGKMRGFEDTRGTLIYNVFKIIEAKQPKVVFLENVKHLVYHDEGRTISTILNGLKNLGYKTSWKVLNASDFGVSQNRERIIIIGNKEREFDFSKLEKQPRKMLKEVLEEDKGQFEYMTEPYTLLPEYTKQPSGLIFVGYRNKAIRKAGVRPGTEHLSRVHKQPNRIYSSEGIHPALPSQESSGRFWILDKGRVRKLTIKECYRIMGFPDEFIRDTSLGEEYRQIGNSVCIPMIHAIVKQIKEQLL